MLQKEVLSAFDLVLTASRPMATPFANQSYAKGREALLSGDPVRAQHCFQLCLDENPEFGPAMLGLGEARMVLRDCPRSWEVLKRAEAIAVKAGDDGLLGLTRHEMGVWLFRQRQLEMFIPTMEAAHATLKPSRGPLEWAEKRLDFARMLLALNDRKQSREVLTQFETHQDLAASAVMAEREFLLGHLDMLEGQSDSALKHIEKAIQPLSSLPAKQAKALAFRYLLGLSRHPGQAESRRLFRQALDLTFAATEDRCFSLELSGYFQLQRGLNAPARDAFTKMLEHATTLGDSTAVAYAHYGLYRTALQDSQLEEAATQIQQAVNQFVGLDRKNQAAGLWFDWGMQNRARGILDRAEDAFSKALNLHAQTEPRAFELSTRIQLGTVLLERGKWDALEVQIQEADRLVQATQSRAHRLNLALLEARFLLQQGEEESCAQKLARLDDEIKPEDGALPFHNLRFLQLDLAFQQRDEARVQQIMNRFGDAT